MRATTFVTQPRIERATLTNCWARALIFADIVLPPCANRASERDGKKNRNLGVQPRSNLHPAQQSYLRRGPVASSPAIRRRRVHIL